jgi:hypothetical protein
MLKAKLAKPMDTKVRDIFMILVLMKLDDFRLCGLRVMVF